MSLASILARRPGGSIPIRRADGTPPPDPGLAFMLAQQKTTQLQLDTHRLALIAEAGFNPGPVIAEAELSLAQIAPLKERHVDAVPRQFVRGRRTADAAADDQEPGAHSPISVSSKPLERVVLFGWGNGRTQDPPLRNVSIYRWFFVGEELVSSRVSGKRARYS